MDIFQFFDQHWFLAWCALWGIWPAFWFGVIAVQLVGFRLPNRLFRTLNVLFRGWPPEHLDADGDFKKVPKQEPIQEPNT